MIITYLYVIFIFNLLIHYEFYIINYTDSRNNKDYDRNISFLFQVLRFIFIYIMTQYYMT